jgi:hypothetical protein
MPTNLKKLVHVRMDKTGESWQTALRSIRDQSPTGAAKPAPEDQDGMAARNRERIAHHEAAHAVAYRAGGAYSQGVSIEPIGDSAGRTHSEEIVWWVGMPKPKKAAVRRQLVGLFAGYAASMRFDPTFDHEALLAESSADFAEARGIIWLSGRSEGELIEEAIQFVENRWRQIQIVARGLLLRTELSGDEVECILLVAEGHANAASSLVYMLEWSPRDVSAVTGVQLRRPSRRRRLKS